MLLCVCVRKIKTENFNKVSTRAVYVCALCIWRSLWRGLVLTNPAGIEPLAFIALAADFPHYLCSRSIVLYCALSSRRCVAVRRCLRLCLCVRDQTFVHFFFFVCVYFYVCVYFVSMCFSHIAICSRSSGNSSNTLEKLFKPASFASHLAQRQRHVYHNRMFH